MGSIKYGYDIDYINDKIKYWSSMRNKYRKLEEERIRNNEAKIASERSLINDKRASTVYNDSSRDIKAQSLGNIRLQCHYPGCNSKDLFLNSEYCHYHYNHEKYTSR